MSSPAYDFWARLDSVRVIPLTKLAEAAGVSYKNIRDQRSLVRLPKLEEAVKLAKALNVSVEYLLTGEMMSGSQMSYEARLVDQDEELKALVRAISHDRRLLSAISAVVRSYEVKVE